MKKVDCLKQPIRSKEEGSILAGLFRTIIRDLNLIDKFGDVIIRAAAKLDNKTEHGITTIVCSDKMTFKVFIFILKYVLNIVSFKITIELQHYNGKRSIHSLKEIKIQEVGEEDENHKTSSAARSK